MARDAHAYVRGMAARTSRAEVEQAKLPLAEVPAPDNRQESVA
jgi:hypothetical protein